MLKLLSDPRSEQTARFASTSDWTPRARLLGILGGWALFGMGVAYVLTMVAGFVASGNLTDPIKDPHLAIMELLILVQAAMLIVMFGVILAYAGRANRVLSLTAFALVCLMAGITISVHFVLLTVGRQVSPAAIPGFTQLFSWQWPSVFYALDILAWDFCFGLALLAAAPIFGGHRQGRWIRAGMLLAGRRGGWQHAGPQHWDRWLRSPLPCRILAGGAGLHANLNAIYFPPYQVMVNKLKRLP